MFSFIGFIRTLETISSKGIQKLRIYTGVYSAIAARVCQIIRGPPWGAQNKDYRP